MGICIVIDQRWLAPKALLCISWDVTLLGPGNSVSYMNWVRHDLWYLSSSARTKTLNPLFATLFWAQIA